jgi:hypothetical protein
MANWNFLMLKAQNLFNKLAALIPFSLRVIAAAILVLTAVHEQALAVRDF